MTPPSNFAKSSNQPLKSPQQLQPGSSGKEPMSGVLADNGGLQKSQRPSDQAGYQDADGYSQMQQNPDLLAYSYLTNAYKTQQRMQQSQNTQFNGQND